MNTDKASLLRILYGVNTKWQLNHWKINQQQDQLKVSKTILTLVKSFLEDSNANYIIKTNELKEAIITRDECTGSRGCGISRVREPTIFCQAIYRVYRLLSIGL